MRGTGAVAPRPRAARAARAPAGLPRVVLHRPTAEDGPEFLRLVRASRALHGTWVEVPSSPVAFARYLARAAGEDDPLPRHVCRLVRDARDGALVGVVNLNDIVWPGVRGASLGYYAFAAHAGRGYVRAGVRELLGHAFGSGVRLHRVEALVQPENVRSRAVIRALGFRREGLARRVLRLGGAWRDHERWALLAEEWRETHARRAAPHVAARHGGRSAVRSA